MLKVAESLGINQCAYSTDKAAGIIFVSKGNED